MKEAPVKRVIMDYLAAKHVMAFRMNTGAVKTGNQFFRFGVVGMADILAFTDKGLVVWIETKGTKGKQSEWQLSFQQMVEARGHAYVLANCLENVYAYFP